MVDSVQNRVRQRPADEELKAIVELLNREHTPLLAEIRTRLNEVIAGLNPQGTAPAAGAAGDFLLVTVGGTEYAIQLYARA